MWLQGRVASFSAGEMQEWHNDTYTWHEIPDLSEECSYMLREVQRCSEHLSLSGSGVGRTRSVQRRPEIGNWDRPPFGKCRGYPWCSSGVRFASVNATENYIAQRVDCGARDTRDPNEILHSLTQASVRDACCSCCVGLLHVTARREECVWALESTDDVEQTGPV